MTKIFGCGAGKLSRQPTEIERQLHRSNRYLLTRSMTPDLKIERLLQAGGNVLFGLLPHDRDRHQAVSRWRVASAMRV